MQVTPWRKGGPTRVGGEVLRSRFLTCNGVGPSENALGSLGRTRTRTSPRTTGIIYDNKGDIAFFRRLTFRYTSRMPIGQFKYAAEHCRTPKQFRVLLKELRTVIPYKRLYTMRGHPSTSTMQYFFNIGFPMDFLRWHWAH